MNDSGKSPSEVLKRLLSGRIADNLIIFIVAIMVCRGIFRLGWPAGHDTLNLVSVYTTLATMLKRFHGLFVLNPNWFCGFLQFLPYGGGVKLLLFGCLTLLFGGNYIFVIKLEMFLVFFLSGLSMYYFSWCFSDSRIVSLVSAFGYMLSQFILIELPYEGHFCVSWGIALTPLLFVAFERAIRSNRSFDAVLAGLFVAFFIGMTYSGYIILSGFFLLFYIIYRCLFFPNRRRIFQRVVKVCLVSSFVAVLVSMFWLLPLFFDGVRPLYFVIEDFEGYSPSLLEALTVYRHSGCSPKYLTPFLGSFGIYLGLWLPVLAVFAYLLRRDKYTLFFLVAAFVSVYFAKGANPPFEQPLVWCYLNIPFFSSLREGARYLLVTSLSYSFLVGVAANEIYSFCQDSGRLERLFGKTITRFSKSVSSHWRKFPGYLCVVAIICLILFYSWIPIITAFKTFDLPEGYIDAYGWVSEHGADGRVFGYPIESWAFYENITPTAIIAPSNFIPIIYGERAFWGGVPFSSPVYTQDFARYLAHLINYNRTTNLGKILGVADVEYIVMDRKRSLVEQVNFLLAQKGFSEVFRNNCSIVLENQWHNPLIFASPTSALVIGGHDVFPSLYEVDGFDPDQWALIFGQQPYDQPCALNIVNKCNAVMFSSPDLLDFIFMTHGYSYTIKAAQYGFRSTNQSEHWILSHWWVDHGKLVLNKDTLVTSGNLSVNIPFEVSTEDQYDVWLRIAYGPNRGELSAKLDDMTTLLSNFRPHADFPAGFGWIRLQTPYLTAGSHTLTLVNDGTGRNDVDAIAVIQPSTLQTHFNKVLNDIQNSHARVVYVLEAENTFTMNGLSGWQISNNQSYYASNGYVLTSETASEASTDIFIPRAGEYIIAIRTVYGPDYGKIVLNVDGSQKSIVNLVDSTMGFGWHEVGPISFDVGNHTLEVINDASGKVDLDEIIIYSLNDDDNNVSLDRIFVTPQTVQVSYTEANPTEYVVHIKAESPFWLILSNSYHPLWRTYIGDEEIQPVVAHSFLNGFYINKTGEFDVKIQFLGQTYANIGGIVSIVTFTAVMGYLIYPKLREARRLRKLLSALKRTKCRSAEL